MQQDVGRVHQELFVQAESQTLSCVPTLHRVLLLLPALLDRTLTMAFAINVLMIGLFALVVLLHLSYFLKDTLKELSLITSRNLFAAID